MTRSFLLGATLLIAALGFSSLGAREKAPTGFQPEMEVREPTRWTGTSFCSAGAPTCPGCRALTTRNGSAISLYVPDDYDPSRPWPLVVFLAPGDDPLGWRHWQQACEKEHLLFCAAYGAGARSSLALRTRVVLDMLDDVRRRYRVDPDQTYLTGFSTGTSLASALAFAYPDYCGGVVAVCGGVEHTPLEYLRLRVRERLSLALVTGPGDFNRRDLADNQSGYFTDLGVRTRLWQVKDLGHAMPEPGVLREIVGWLTEDVPRRRAATRQAGQANDDAPTAQALARRMLEAAETEVHQPDKLFHGVALLEGILARYDKTDSAPKAEKRLKEIQSDPRRRQALREQRAAEEKRTLAARARALERAGDLRKAFDAWGALTRAQVGTADGTQAAREMARVKQLLDATPYLGLHLEGESAIVKQVLPQGPAEQAGLRPGDRLLKLGRAPIASLSELRQAVQKLKPGQRVSVTVQRGEQTRTLELEVGRPPT